MDAISVIYMTPINKKNSTGEGKAALTDIA
jgi:hypothetical protein